MVELVVPKTLRRPKAKVNTNFSLEHPSHGDPWREPAAPEVMSTDFDKSPFGLPSTREIANHPPLHKKVFLTWQNLWIQACVEVLRTYRIARRDKNRKIMVASVVSFLQLPAKIL